MILCFYYLNCVLFSICNSLWTKLADDILMIVPFFFLKKTYFGVSYKLSSGDSLHEMSNPVFWGKSKKKYFKMSSAEILTKHAVL